MSSLPLAAPSRGAAQAAASPSLQRRPSQVQCSACASCSSRTGSAARAGGALGSSSQRSRRRQCQPPAAIDPLSTLAATDPALLQDMIVGGAVTAAVGAALYSGLKKDPEPCELCMGTGGIKCFACQGGDISATSSLSSVDEDTRAAAKPPKRDFVGRTSNPRACRVCGGTGLVLCSQCKGAGYVSKF